MVVFSLREEMQTRFPTTTEADAEDLSLRVADGLMVNLELPLFMMPVQEGELELLEKASFELNRVSLEESCRHRC